jgi:pimeloyl-ACP methyl ester carboxylesterase
VDLYSETPVNAARVFNLLFQDCAADPYCKQTYPDLEQTLYRVIDKLNAGPAQVTLSAGAVTVDGGHFLDLLFGALYHADAIPWIPAMIRAVDTGNLDAISSTLEALFRDAISEGAYYSTECRDEVPFQSPAEASALASGLPPQLLAFDFYAPSFVFDLCESWESGVAGAIEDQPVVSDIPALVLGGQYDPVTPSAWGRLAAETLGNGFFYEFRGIGHGAIRSNACALEIGLQFLDDPTTEPDASCIDALSGPDFK